MPLGGYAPLPLRLGGSALDGLTAEQLCRLSADVLAVKRTGPLAFLEIQTDTLNSYYGMNGTGAAVADISPSVSGLIVTFEPVWIDPYEVEHPIHIRHAIASHGGGGTNYRPATVDITAANVVRVRKFDDTGGAITTLTAFLRVW